MRNPTPARPYFREPAAPLTEAELAAPMDGTSRREGRESS